MTRTNFVGCRSPATSSKVESTYERYAANLHHSALLLAQYLPRTRLGYPASVPSSLRTSASQPSASVEAESAAVPEDHTVNKMPSGKYSLFTQCEYVEVE